MWLRVANSNNDPKVVAKHFIDCVQLIQGTLLCCIIIDAVM